jgi:CRP-like cAMP-binding protein
MATELTQEVLAQFSPMDGLKRKNLVALLKKTAVKKLDGGRTLFKLDENDKRTFYLLTGSIELSSRLGEQTVIRAGTPEARNAIAPHLPRQCTARAVDDIEVLAIDTDLLDVMLTWDQTGNYQVGDLRSNEEDEEGEEGDEGDNGDWMTTLLQTQAFQRIPPANIQAIFIRMQQIHFTAGDVVIKQGDEGDYFYAITRGQCAVVRETPLNKEGIKLAELKVGDTFGEEALISESKRNATVTMMTDGAVMRLAKDDFKTLMNEPMLDWVDYTQAKALAIDGAVWLDVRLPSEFASFHESDAINIPLYFIRLKLNTLDENTTYIVCCDTGSRSSAGAFILNERGFNTHVLTGGLNSD